MKILVAYDGSSCADAALHNLKRAGLPDKAETVVISVAEVWLPPPSSYEILGSENVSTLPARKEHARKLADEAAAGLRKLFPGWDVTAVSDVGSPAGNILDFALKFGPDLIVVGSHGFSVAERVVLGSVSQRVVTEARCSVRVARGKIDEEPDAPVRILIGCDGSEESEKALDVVSNRSWPPGSEIRLITSAGPYGDIKKDDDAFRELVAPVEEMLQKYADKMGNTGFDVSTKVTFEDPKHAIIDEAQSWGADTIFVGSRGLGRIGRLFLGSVSSAVTARANCSVEVTRIPEAK